MLRFKELKHSQIRINTIYNIKPATKYTKFVLPDLIRQPVISLDSAEKLYSVPGFRGNDERKVFARRINILALIKIVWECLLVSRSHWRYAAT